MSNSDPATILIVDDDITNLRILVAYLQGMGYTTIVAESGKRALEQIEQVIPDLILLDVVMPEINGYETCKRIKADPLTADVPIIFMTALADTEHKLEGFQAGAVDYVTKPFQREEISARISTHLMIRKQRRDLEELNATKDKLFSVIGHDLRGPFTVLLGFSEIFADPTRELTAEQQQRFGSLINQSARNALNLLENLLTWARMQQGTMVTRPHMVNLTNSAHETLELLCNSARVKQINLGHTLADNTMVFADRNMLDTILRNLLSNAIKFTPEGGSVTLSAESCETMTAVSVTDTGLGMPDEIIAEVMDVNPNSEKVTDAPNNGLGLVLCREFIERSGGTIRIVSVEGEGTTFTFTMPTIPTLDIQIAETGTLVTS